MSGLGQTQNFGVPTLQGQNLGPQSNGMGLTTGAPPNKPDFASYFGKPLREVKTNPYEGYASLTQSSGCVYRMFKHCLCVTQLCSRELCVARCVQWPQPLHHPHLDPIDH